MITYKSAKEIQILIEGGKRHSAILRKLREMIVPTLSARVLNDFALSEINKYGDTPAFLGYTPDGAKRPYPAALCVSLNDEIVHGIPNEKEKILKEGDIVSIDLGLVHQGLITDGAFTCGVGKISKEDQNLIKMTEKALWFGIEEAKAGNTTGDIGFAIESVARSAGLNITEGLAGHGVGYHVHEDPYVPNYGEKGMGDILKTGMVIAIEPMLTSGSGAIILAKDGYTYKTKDGRNCAHFEHTVVITEGDPIVVTA
jgi:methionyl aminopeptidase